MKEGARAFRLTIAGYETLMEGEDMRASILTLAAGESVPWHYHTETTDAFVCLDGTVVVETRAPRAQHVLAAGQRCAVPPRTAHHVHGLEGTACQFLILQGVGEYDNVAVG
jgi:quercetin dioxygenase-like cupin family protein